MESIFLEISHPLQLLIIKNVNSEKTLSSLLRRLVIEELIPLSTLKYHAKKLIRRGYVEWKKGAPLSLTEKGRALLSLLENA